MRVFMGNAEPVGAPGPAISWTEIRDDVNEDGSYVAGYVVGTDAMDVKEHLFDNPGYVTHLPGNEAIVSLTRSLADHLTGKPTWVAVEAQDRDPANADDFERFLSEFWKCDRGFPIDLEDTHHTFAGPPGVGPSEGA